MESESRACSGNDGWRAARGLGPCLQLHRQALTGSGSLFRPSTAPAWLNGWRAMSSDTASTIVVRYNLSWPCWTGRLSVEELHRLEPAVKTALGHRACKIDAGCLQGRPLEARTVANFPSMLWTPDISAQLWPRRVELGDRPIEAWWPRRGREHAAVAGRQRSPLGAASAARSLWRRVCGKALGGGFSVLSRNEAGETSRWIVDSRSGNLCLASMANIDHAPADELQSAALVAGIRDEGRVVSRRSWSSLQHDQQITNDHRNRAIVKLDRVVLSSCRHPSGHTAAFPTGRRRAPARSRIVSVTEAFGAGGLVRLGFIGIMTF